VGILGGNGAQEGAADAKGKGGGGALDLGTTGPIVSCQQH